MTLMTPTKIVVYTLLIVSIILGLLLSMLNLERAQEFNVAKWAICGVLSVIVVGVSFVNLRFFAKSAHITIWLIIKMIVIPLLVLILAVVFFSLMGKDDLSEKIFFQAPLLPVFLVFCASIVAHLAYLYLNRSTRN